MPPLDLLFARIRGEYREMPGLRVTFTQACRLWQLDAATCEVVLHTLQAEGFLTCTPNGMFVSLPAPKAAAALPLAIARESAGTAGPQRRSA
jgi:hypothetical protein